MAPISGIQLSLNKHVWVGLTSIFGVGRTQALKACAGANIKPNTLVKDLTESEVAALRSQIGKLTVEGDLSREGSINIKRLMDPGFYRGIRHRRALPLRGQRTRTNARTRKGPRKA